MNALMDFVQIWYRDRTYKEEGSFRKWASYVKNMAVEDAFLVIINEHLHGLCSNLVHR